MGSSFPGVLGLAFFLLLLLPPLLPSSGAYQPRAPTWLDFHHLRRARRNLPSDTNQDGESTRHGHSQDTGSRERLEDHKQSCQSNLDLYLILDKSGSVDTNWIFTYGFVEDFLKIFENPNMRVSIVTFSTLGHTVLKLTSDKKEIEVGLNKLRNTVPTGDTNMQEGFKAVNEQISTANSAEKKVHSMVVSLIDGTLWPESFEATKNELLAIADSEEHVVGVDSGFYDLKNIVDSLAAKSCIELTSVEPTDYCVGENYDVGIFGRGFHNTKNKNEVLCRFNISDTIFFAFRQTHKRKPWRARSHSTQIIALADEKATQVEDTSIKCPGVKIEIPANEISVEVSLNNGASFISNGLKISIKDCGSHRTGQRTHISRSGVPPKYNSSIIRSMRKVLRRYSGQVPGLQVLQPPIVPIVAAASPTNQGTEFPDINPYHLATILLIIVLPLLIWSWWRLRSRKNKEPADKKDMLGMEIMGNFFQKCNGCPTLLCQPRRKMCSLFRSRCGKLPGLMCFPFNCSWSRCPNAPCQHPQLSCSQPPQFVCSSQPPGCSP